jgi:TIR domain
MTNDHLKIGEHLFRKVYPGVFPVPVSALGDFRMSDVPAHSTIELIEIPVADTGYDLSISVTNGGDEGDDKYLTIFGCIGFVTPVHTPQTEIDRKMNRARRAYAPLVEQGLLPDPLSFPRKLDDRIEWAAGFNLDYRGRAETIIQTAIRPLLTLFMRFVRYETRLFICHASENKDTENELASFLQNNGAEVWLDQWEIKVGDSIVQKISDGLSTASHLAILLSRHSITKPWVTKELSSALMRQLSDRSIRVLPILLDESPIPAILADVRYADCRTDTSIGFREVLDALFSTEPR